MSAFDPFTATYEQALERYNNGDRKALAQLFSVWELDADRAYYEANPVDGVAECVSNGLVVPNWLAALFLEGVQKVRDCHVSSWDKAFGAPYKKSVDLPAKRRALENTPAVIQAFRRLVMNNPSIPIDPDFWEQVGEAVGMSGGTARKLWKAAHKHLRKGKPSEVKAKLIEKHKL